MRYGREKVTHMAVAAVVVTGLLGCWLRADQVGIDKVRLFEEQLGQYVLEVDTTPRFLSAYRSPVLPDRLELTDFHRDQHAGYVVLRYRFRSHGEPLDDKDELLLPWGRAGASITAQWHDGSMSQNLFLRDFEGIRVPIRLLRETKPSVLEFVWENVLGGMSHAAFGWNHWLLVLAVGLLAPGWWRIGLLVLFAVGHALSLVLVDLGLFLVGDQVSEICIIVVALLVARVAPLDKLRCQAFSSVMIIAGLIHGQANAKSLLDTGAAESELVQALFAFNLGIDVLQLASAVLIGACWIPVAKSRFAHSIGWPAQVLVGGVAIGLLLIVFSGGRFSPQMENDPQSKSGPFELPDADMMTRGTGNQPPPTRVLKDPVAGFLTVEPYEIRLEVLVRLALAREWLELPEDGETIAITEQEQIKQQLVDVITQHLAVRRNGSDSSPALCRANFVTVEPNGIFSRPTPVDEPIDDAVVGVTFVYDTAEMADDVQLDWRLFSSEVESVPAAVTDPFGGKRHVLTPEKAELTWKNRWSGYRPPEIKPVSVSKPRFPLISLLLVVAAIGIQRFYGGCERQSRRRTLLASVLFAALLAYPFARVSMGAPLVAVWQPSKEQATDILERLLSNVYRAYDMRDEEAIYDRLALTITGEQLTEIYLDTRRSLELENRGGARAKVDEVEIQEIYLIEQAAEAGFNVELTWNVRGSVTHFGHTHYRRNRYRAIVTIVPQDEHWKIKTIDVGEQQRLL